MTHFFTQLPPAFQRALKEQIAKWEKEEKDELEKPIATPEELEMAWRDFNDRALDHLMVTVLILAGSLDFSLRAEIVRCFRAFKAHDFDVMQDRTARLAREVLKLSGSAQ